MKNLIISLVIVLMIGLSFSLGFFSSYNYFTAKREIKANHFKKICINEKHLWFIVEEKMGDKYGIDIVNISNPNETRPINYYGIMIYNRTMMRGFIKRNGENTYRKYKSDLDSLMKQRIYR
jgi:hypothetical protein